MPRLTLSPSQPSGIGDHGVKLVVRHVATIDNTLKAVDEEGASVGHVQ
ncbi:hypothetical protein [Sphingomonas aurantiaca]|nr:hypothetical protein [Sphingomonas aurantiaca]